VPRLAERFHGRRPDSDRGEIEVLLELHAVTLPRGGSHMLTWGLLVLAIAVEVAATSALKPAGEGNVIAILGVGLGYGTAIVLMAIIVRKLEVGVVYAIWSGAGTALVAVVGILIFGESLTALKVLGLLMIVGGVAALNLTGAH
jgi:small multidrug resistance pump